MDYFLFLAVLLSPAWVDAQGANATARQSDAVLRSRLNQQLPSYLELCRDLHQPPELSRQEQPAF